MNPNGYASNALPVEVFDISGKRMNVNRKGFSGASLEFLKCLHGNEVRYLLVGGYAVSWHGYPRTTADMDIWIELSNENAKKVKKALVDFGIVSEIPNHVFTRENEEDREN